MTTTLRVLPALFALLTGSAAFAQSAGSLDPAQSDSRPPDLQHALEAWRKDHGPTWQMIVDPRTARARLLYSGSARPQFKPHDDADFVSLARLALAGTHTLHGIDAATLVEDEVVFLPLGNAGSTDKITVQFRQEVGGVPVVGGYATALFDVEGRLFSIDTTGLPDLAGFDTRALVPADEATEAAFALFSNDTGLAANELGDPQLVIEQSVRGDVRIPVLAWEVEVRWSAADSEPEGTAYRIDARSGALVGRKELIHHDVSGNVKSRATPGVLPDKTGNTPTLQNMPHMTVTSSQGNAETDVNGNFTIVGATAPVSVTVTYNGPFTTSQNQAGANYSLTQNLTLASGNAITMNPTSVATVTSQANTFLWINKQRDWTRTINPSDPKSDFDAASNVNIASTCNAYYNGGSVNFFLTGGGCVNTAYSTVSAHEVGHWMNDKYGSGNGPDGFGEGNADVFAMYLTDNAIVGQDFCGTGCHIRNGNNTRSYCGDCCGGCYGEVHADGEVLMGAMWKVRTRLKTSLGASAGSLAADTLFNSWMNAYNDNQIHSIIETHWLVLDDNDGNVDNGTPHFSDIDLGFRAQGFPGVTLHPFSFANVTALPNTQDETGPYVVNADVATNLAPPMTALNLLYRTNGGSYSSVPMSFVSGNTFTASIPGQSSLATVDYYLSATDSAAQTQSFPAGAPGDALGFIIGVERVFLFEDFESGTSNWMSGAYSGGQDGWGEGVPAGAAGDPTLAYSGQRVWGNDLGSGSDGEYENNTDVWLHSPTLDLTEAVTPVLRFKRWLTVERGTKDQARVYVNGAEVWANPTNVDLIDTAWQTMEIDISAFAAGDPQVAFEWRMTADGGGTKGGWNIDDVEVLTRSATGEDCASPTSYCAGKLNTAGEIPFMGFNGAPSVTLNNFELRLFDAVPLKAGIVFYGSAPASVPFFGGTRCVASPFKRGPQFTTTADGYAGIPIAVDLSLLGVTRYYQCWYRDPTDPQTVGLSNGLEVRFCN